jgi:hypothetical protein
VLRFAPPLRRLLDHALQVGLQRGDRILEALLLLLGQLVELLRAHHLVLAHRREAEPARRAQQRDALRLGVLADLAEGLLLVLAEGGFDLLPPAAVLVGLERGRDPGAQVLHQPLHALLEARRAAGGQAQRARLVRRVEVEHVAPVRRHFARGGGLLQEAAYDGAAP